MEQNLATSKSFPAAEVIQHWLLNTAVEFGVPLTYLFPDKSQGLNVKPIPGCSSEDYAGGLIELFNSGMITLSSEFPEDDVTTRSGVSRILDRFWALPKDYRRGRYLRPGDPSSLVIDRNPAMEVDFQLTELGGEAWARIAAEPDWTHLLVEQRDSTCGDLFSANRDLLMAYMGWYPEINQEHIQLDTITFETHNRFEILYWKRLPLVYHASFRLRAAEPRWGSAVPIWYMAPKWFLDWQRSAVSSWYKKPWDLEAWPSP